MRFFYLRSEDKVKDFFSGFTQCKHGRVSDPARSARECERCLRELIDSDTPAFRPGSPVGCIASELVGDTVFYAVSVCSSKDTWNKRIARTMALNRLHNRDKHLKRVQTSQQHKVVHTGSVSVNDKPVKIEVLKRVAADQDLPRHARRAAEVWLLKHPPKPVVASSEGTV